MVTQIVNKLSKDRLVFAEYFLFSTSLVLSRSLGYHAGKRHDVEYVENYFLRISLSHKKFEPKPEHVHAAGARHGREEQPAGYAELEIEVF